MQRDPVAVRELDVLEQTPAGKGVDLAVKIRNAVLIAACRKRQTVGLAAGVAAVGASGKDNLSAVRLREGNISLRVQAQVLCPRAAPPGTEGAVGRVAAAVVGAIQRQRRQTEIREGIVRRFQQEVAGVEVDRLKAVGAELVASQQAHVQRAVVHRRFCLAAEGVVSAVELV